MSKSITPEQTEEFRQFCTNSLEDEENGDAAYFTIESYDAFSEEDEEGDPMWEFGAKNYDPKNHDFYDLFASVPEFVFEEEGHGSFYISRRAT